MDSKKVPMGNTIETLLEYSVNSNRIKGKKEGSTLKDYIGFRKLKEMHL